MARGSLRLFLPTITRCRPPLVSAIAFLVLLIPACGAAQSASLSGKVLDLQGLPVASAQLRLTSAAGTTVQDSLTDAAGFYIFPSLSAGSYTLIASARGFDPISKTVDVPDGKPVLLDVQFASLARQDSVVIVNAALEPDIDRLNEDVYQKTLFERDDQLLETLGAGINAGQHEGGGKSLEIRRFGFNLDHGGVNGGLKVVVNDMPQNQASQGHGQGYLGALKALTPELVSDVTIFNGPFSAAYGDFSGLGVVQIRTRESLPDILTLRSEAGSFDTYRTFLAYSPALEHADSFVSYEGSYTNGPFENHLRYKRNNFIGNYTWHLPNDQDLSLKGNFGTNNFYSSGQIPLDLVYAGVLDRFGFIDPSDGGNVRLGAIAGYYRKQFSNGDSFKVDAFFGRSLFDLYSNFTFYLVNPVTGDAIQQHDSRAQEGVNTQYLHSFRIASARALLAVGANFDANEINVGLYPRIGRVPIGVTTRSLLFIPNVAPYAQQSLDFLNGRLHLEAGLRWDYFHWRDDDQVNAQISGVQTANRLQPKAAVAFSPSRAIPLTLSFNYGRGINTQDARGIIERPDSPRIATTDFSQAGIAYNRSRLSLSADAFLIDRSNEEVYIPDDGTFEFKGPSRSYGYEGKGAFRLNSFFSLNGSLTQVTQSFYLGTSPRLYVDSAPHNVASAGLTLSGWRGVFGSFRWRHIGNYRLDDLDPTIRASGLDVIDLALSKTLRPWVDFNFDIDNLTDKRYFETQNFFESRVTLSAPAIYRIHGTPGYPFSATAGLTFHLFPKR